MTAAAPARRLDPTTRRLFPARLSVVPVGIGVAAVAAAAVAGMAFGAVSLSPLGVFLEFVDSLPFIDVDSGLSERQAAIVRSIRMPRVALGLLVGAMLGMSGAAYQGVFRNPLADPYLLGVAAGAGLGATVAIVNGAAASSGPLDPVPLSAFVGALAAVAMTYALGAAGASRSPTSLILGGVAVASFLTAIQTYLQQRNTDTIRSVYAWVLGRLTTSGWDEVLLLLPYVVISGGVLFALRRHLDILAVGDTEAASLGMPVGRIRLVVVIVASLGTAAAVSVSGLIAFVGIIVPHTVRLIAGSSNRVVLPLSILFGAAFLAAADLLARMALSPAEVPIGVVTAFFGAPFFIVVLRTSGRTLS